MRYRTEAEKNGGHFDNANCCLCSLPQQLAQVTHRECSIYQHGVLPVKEGAKKQGAAGTAGAGDIRGVQLAGHCQHAVGVCDIGGKDGGAVDAAARVVLVYEALSY